MRIEDIDRIESIDGYPVSIQNPPDDLTDEELHAYVERGLAKYGKSLSGLELRFDPPDVEINYIVNNVPFQRVRRITGYLVGGMERWNDAKKAEEHDRVKHDTE